MNLPEFTVILVSWNTADRTLEAIQSVIEDSEASRISVETIVVDNGSTDRSVARIAERFPQTVIIENGRNLGFAKAVNRGLAAATGKHVMLLNTDARLVPGALRAFSETLTAVPEIGIVGGMLLDPDETPQNSIAPFPTLVTELANKSLLKWLSPRKHARKIGPDEHEIREVDTIVGACFVMRGETAKAIGPLDERFFFFFEETDWCFQAQARGWRVAVNPRARILHGQGESSQPVLTETRIEFYRSRYRYFLKNRGRAKTMILMEGMILKLCVETLFALMLVAILLGQSRRWNNRLKVVATLLFWHIRGCPGHWGLEGKFANQ